MRIFNTAQELWSYCLFCPLCKEPSRTIKLTVGPDDDFNLAEFQKEGNELKIFCSFFPDVNKRKKNRHSAIHIINCENNTFEVEASGSDSEVIERIKKAYFYCYLHAKCNLCDNTSLDTMDIEFDVTNKKIYNLQIDRESAFLLSEKDKYHVSLSHTVNKMMVSRLSIEDNVLIDSDKIIDLPLVNLDFTDVPKVVNKLKTLILFS